MDFNAHGFPVDVLMPDEVSPFDHFILLVEETCTILKPKKKTKFATPLVLVCVDTLIWSIICFHLEDPASSIGPGPILDYRYFSTSVHNVPPTYTYTKSRKISYDRTKMVFVACLWNPFQNPHPRRFQECCQPLLPVYCTAKLELKAKANFFAGRRPTTGSVILHYSCFVSPSWGRKQDSRNFCFVSHSCSFHPVISGQFCQLVPSELLSCHDLSCLVFVSHSCSFHPVLSGSFCHSKSVPF